MSVCMNCSTHGAEDMDVISHLIKIRLKPKVLLNHYMLCIRCAGGAGDGCGGGGRGVASRGVGRGGQPLQLPLPGRTQGAAERAQGQPGHHDQVRDLQRALQCAEPQQHADPVYRAPAQLRAGAQGGPWDPLPRPPRERVREEALAGARGRAWLCSSSHRGLSWGLWVPGSLGGLLLSQG